MAALSTTSSDFCGACPDHLKESNLSPPASSLRHHQLLRDHHLSGLEDACIALPSRHLPRETPTVLQAWLAMPRPAPSQSPLDIESRWTVHQALYIRSRNLAPCLTLARRGLGSLRDFEARGRVWLPHFMTLLLGFRDRTQARGNSYGSTCPSRILFG